jgi:hypothetical protein
MKTLFAFLLTFLPVILSSAESRSLLEPRTATAKALDKPGVYEKGGTVFAQGESIHVVAKREAAELAALRDAAAKMAKLLAKEGLGPQRELARGVESSVLRETELLSWKLGRVKIEHVYQERWDAPDGKEAWSVRMMISIRRQSSVKRP